MDYSAIFRKVQTGESQGEIVVGDCLSVMAEMPDGCVDLVVTDPPYGIEYVSARPKRPWKIHVPVEGDTEAIWHIWPKIAEEMYRVCKDDSALVVCTRWDQWSRLVALTKPWKVKNMIVWDKGTHSAGDLDGNFGFAHELLGFFAKGRPRIHGRRVWNVWRVPKVPAAKLRHSCEKPLPLVEIAIRALTEPGQLVADFFVGSGTTAVAAKRLGRHYFGCDINPGCVGEARERLTRTQLRLA